MRKTDTIQLTIQWDTDHQIPPHEWDWQEILHGVAKVESVAPVGDNSGGE